MCNQSVITQCVINDDDGRGEKRSKGRERRGTDERGRERRRREKKRREKRTRRKERERIRGKIGDKRTDYTLCNQLRVIGKGDYTTRNQ